MIDSIFTVDVEEYYHAENIQSSFTKEKIEKLPDRVHIGVRKILNLLKQHKSRATFFVLGCLAEKNKDLIKEIHDTGHEIASHGYRHIPLYKHNAATFDEDLKKSIDILSEITGEKIIGYRASNFSYTDDMPWFFDLLKKYEIVYDSSLSLSLFRPSHRKFIKRISSYNIAEVLLEFPASFIKIGPVRFPLGGGYFRAYPYWLTKLGLSLTNPERRTPPLFYIHPWELDPEQPRFKIPPVMSLRHYANLHTTENKLKKLFSEMKFISIKNYLEKKGLYKAHIK